MQNKNGVVNMRYTIKTMRDNLDKFPVCPRCNGLIPNNLYPASHVGALSRLDNKTEICSECGAIEAMLDYQGKLTDWRNT